MKMDEMMRLLEVVDAINDLGDLMKKIVGTGVDSNSILARLDKIYGVIRAFMYEGFDMQNEEVFERVMNIVNDGNISTEKRAGYILTGKM